MRHSKRYKRTGTGVELFCSGEVIADSPYRDSNFSITNCVKCGMDVITIGHSPETDKVKETR